MKTELNKSIRMLELPDRLKSLKISDEGYPIPWFVPYVNGKPDFRGFDGDKLVVAVRHHRCWMCGTQLGRYMTFAIGPMCMITEVISEPPSHLDCLEYAVQACPFLTQPRMKRNEVDLPEDRSVAGIAIRRNPGVVALWTTKNYKVFKANGGVLFRLSSPEHIEYYAKGRIATLEEIIESIDSGLPLLQEEAKKDGPDALQNLEKQYKRVVETVNAKFRREDAKRQTDIAG